MSTLIAFSVIWISNEIYAIYHIRADFFKGLEWMRDATLQIFFKCFAYFATQYFVMLKGEEVLNATSCMAVLLYA